MRDAPSRKLSLATRRTSKPRESFVFQTGPSNEVNKGLAEVDDESVSLVGCRRSIWAKDECIRSGILEEGPRNGETGKVAILVTKSSPGKEVF